MSPRTASCRTHPPSRILFQICSVIFAFPSISGRHGTVGACATGAENGPIRPEPVQDDGEATGHGDGSPACVDCVACRMHRGHPDEPAGVRVRRGCHPGAKV